MSDTLKQKMIAAVESYISHFNAADFEAIALLYAQDATVEDPIGTPLKNGREEIRSFYEGAVQGGSKLELVSPIRLADKEAAFAFKVTVEAANMIVEVIDTFKFNEAGEVIEMRAYWGPENVTKTG